MGRTPEPFSGSLPIESVARKRLKANREFYRIPLLTDPCDRTHNGPSRFLNGTVELYMSAKVFPRRDLVGFVDFGEQRF